MRGHGARPGTGSAPLGYRLRFDSLARAVATSMRTIGATFLASFDVSTFMTHGMCSPPTRQACRMESRRSRGTGLARRYSANSFSALPA